MLLNSFVAFVFGFSPYFYVLPLSFDSAALRLSENGHALHGHFTLPWTYLAYEPDLFNVDKYTV